jgi:hypothetical protein
MGNPRVAAAEEVEVHAPAKTDFHHAIAKSGASPSRKVF